MRGKQIGKKSADVNPYPGVPLSIQQFFSAKSFKEAEPIMETMPLTDFIMLIKELHQEFIVKRLQDMHATEFVLVGILRFHLHWGFARQLKSKAMDKRLREALVFLGEDPDKIFAFPSEELGKEMQKLRADYTALEDRMSMLILARIGEQEAQTASVEVAHLFDGKLSVTPDGMVRIGARHDREIQPHVGQIIFAFARKKGAGYVSYRDLNVAVNGENAGEPRKATQASLRKYTSRAEKALQRHFPNAKITSYAKGSWLLEE